MKLYNRNNLIYGVGINDADYTINKCINTVDGGKINWRCHYYDTWKGMLRRCYSSKFHQKRPSYIGCSVCDEWLTFSNFKAWMELQDWEGKQLDKDLLKEGNKVYSPEHCIFVDSKINTFVIDRGNDRGECMIGVNWHKRHGKYISKCSNPFTGKREHLGLFNNELDAHLAWKARKHELSCQLANSEYCNDPRLAQALKVRYI